MIVVVQKRGTIFIRSRYLEYASYQIKIKHGKIHGGFHILQKELLVQYMYWRCMWKQQPTLPSERAPCTVHVLAMYVEATADIAFRKRSLYSTCTGDVCGSNSRHCLQKELLVQYMYWRRMWKQQPTLPSERAPCTVHVLAMYVEATVDIAFRKSSLYSTCTGDVCGSNSRHWSLRNRTIFLIPRYQHNGNTSTLLSLCSGDDISVFYSRQLTSINVTAGTHMNTDYMRVTLNSALHPLAGRNVDACPLLTVIYG